MFLIEDELKKNKRRFNNKQGRRVDENKLKWNLKRRCLLCRCQLKTLKRGARERC